MQPGSVQALVRQASVQVRPVWAQEQEQRVSAQEPVQVSEPDERASGAAPLQQVSVLPEQVQV